jgi:hypothetical protein
MPYRSNQPAIDAALAEQEELRALAREARGRRRLAVAVLGGAFALVAGVVGITARLPSPPKVHCHKVVLEYEPSHGPYASPPPASWLTCETR